MFNESETGFVRNNFSDIDTLFTNKERTAKGLNGLVPPAVETSEIASKRVMGQLASKATALEKCLYLYEIYRNNANLFFSTASRNLKELLPIIYTPTIGEAVSTYSKNYVKQIGLIINIEQQDEIESILRNYKNSMPHKEANIIIATDAEGILGIGDQGVGGIYISIGKLMVYTLCGGINPAKAVPIMLDVGTNNEELLNDPLYLGLKKKRPAKDKYYAFIDSFVNAFRKVFPNALLHWEDFGKDNASEVLERYRKVHCSFNDDVQGTGVITLAALLAGIEKTKTAPENHKIVMMGAGTAACGISEIVISYISKKTSIPREDLYKNFYLLNSKGLLTEKSQRLNKYQIPFIKESSSLASWNIPNPDYITLEDVVKNVKPTVLIGCSTVSGAFTPEILSLMAEYNENPIIMPLSNPTSKSEALPADIIRCTNGKALIAAGSPFAPVEFNGKTYSIAQCNNALAFPGIGLGVLASGTPYISDNMLLAVAEGIYKKAKEENNGTLLPSFNNIIALSKFLGKLFYKEAIAEGYAIELSDKEIEKKIDNLVWLPK